MGCRKHLQSADDGGNSQDSVYIQNGSNRLSSLRCQVMIKEVQKVRMGMPRREEG